MFWNKSNPDLNQLPLETSLKINKEKWKVAEISTYDWSVDGKSIEYLLRSGDGREVFLEVERVDGENEIYFSEKISISRETLEQAIREEEISYEGVNFELEERYNGAFKNETLMTSWRAVGSFLFYDFNEMILTIEVVENSKFQAYYGKQLHESDIKF